MKQIFAQRLKSARIMAGLSLQNLAEKLEGTTITRQALHKYESAVALPGSTVLLALSNALNVSPDYFFKTTFVSLDQVEFRKKTRLGVKAEAGIREVVKEKIMKYINVEEILHKNPAFTNPLKDVIIENNQAAEQHSLQLRNAWNLGLNPVSNVLEMLENVNIKIIEFDAPAEFDGLSAWVDGMPLIVINKNLDIVRKRFTAIHELGHLILKFSDSGKKTEKLCHYFAAAFLIPESVLKAELGNKRNRISISEIIGLKEYYGISVQALMKRVFDLEIITETQYKNFIIWINKNQLRDEMKLGYYPGKEKAIRFEQMVHHALAEELISFGKASELLDVPVHVLRSEFQIA